MDKMATLASDILLGIGGEQNILRLENCMTRVRGGSERRYAVGYPASETATGRQWLREAGGAASDHRRARKGGKGR